MDAGRQRPQRNPHALTVHDDGSGPALYVGGQFEMAGGIPSRYVARWRQGAWSPATNGLALPSTNEQGVHALAVYDDGTGPQLFGGGQLFLGPFVFSRLIRWDGTSWSPAATYQSQGYIRAFAVHDFGSGPGLYAAGNFAAPSAGMATTPNILRFDAGGVSAVAGGIGNTVFALKGAPFPGGPLFAGGSFKTVGGTVVSPYFAELRRARPQLAFAQPGGPGTGVFVRNADLQIGGEYFNLFSSEATPGLRGHGPFLGLYASNPSVLVAQLGAPIGTLPGHFVAKTGSTSFGPYLLPPGTYAEGICIHIPSICSSTVAWISVQ